MDLLKAEIARKRKQLQETGLVQPTPGAQHFKRAALSEAAQAKIQKDHMKPYQRVLNVSVRLLVDELSFSNVVCSCRSCRSRVQNQLLQYVNIILYKCVEHDVIGSWRHFHARRLLIHRTQTIPTPRATMRGNGLRLT
jgi:hypothetical protein